MPSVSISIRRHAVDRDEVLCEVHYHFVGEGGMETRTLHRLAFERSERGPVTGLVRSALELLLSELPD